jgi:hypothetical protein
MHPSLRSGSPAAGSVPGGERRGQVYPSRQGNARVAVDRGAVKTEDAHRELLAYELQARATTPPRRTRPWVPAGAIVAAALLVSAGAVAGVLVRNRAVDDQRRRAAVAEQQTSSLRRDAARKQRAIDAGQRQIARDREELARLRERIAHLARPQEPPPAAAAASSFADGLYQVGVAIQPGQYRTNGADSCYWAKLSTGDTNRVIVNKLGAGAQSVTIDSPYFESEGCGTWTKVG